MSGEMRKKTAKWIRRAGPTSFRPARAPFPSVRAAGILPDSGGFSRHAPWASAIAAKFSAREDHRGVPRPSLIDLAFRGRVTILSRFISRQPHQHHHQTAYDMRRNTMVWQLFPKVAGDRRFGSKETPEERSRANVGRSAGRPADGPRCAASRCSNGSVTKRGG